MFHRTIDKHYLLLSHPFRLVAFLAGALSVELLRDGNPGYMDILHHGPDNRQATGFRGEDVNLIRAPSNIAKQAGSGIGAANGAMHHLRESIKRKPMLFIFRETADRGHG